LNFKLDRDSIRMDDDPGQDAAHEGLTAALVQAIETARDQPAIPECGRVPIGVSLARREPDAGFVEPISRLLGAFASPPPLLLLRNGHDPDERRC